MILFLPIFFFFSEGYVLQFFHRTIIGKQRMEGEENWEAGTIGKINLCKNQNLASEQLPNLTGQIHHLPCCIKHEGPCAVSQYFKPKPSGLSLSLSLCKFTFLFLFFSYQLDYLCRHWTGRTGSGGSLFQRQEFAGCYTSSSTWLFWYV